MPPGRPPARSEEEGIAKGDHQKVLVNTGARVSAGASHPDFGHCRHRRPDAFLQSKIATGWISIPQPVTISLNRGYKV